MNYGYDPTPKDLLLAKELQKFVNTLPLDDRGKRPYIEVNCMYPGVRIRRITHYSRDMINYIAKVSDGIYREVVGDPPGSESRAAEET